MLTNANTGSSGQTLTDGTVVAGSDAVLGAGTTTVSDGTLGISSVRRK